MAFFLLISEYGQPEVCFNLPLLYEAEFLPSIPARAIVLPSEAKLLHFLIFGKCAKGFVFMSALGGSTPPAVPVSALALGPVPRICVLMLLADMISAFVPRMRMRMSGRGSFEIIFAMRRHKGQQAGPDPTPESSLQINKAKYICFAINCTSI